MALSAALSVCIPHHKHARNNTCLGRPPHIKPIRKYCITTVSQIRERSYTGVCRQQHRPNENHTRHPYPNTEAQSALAYGFAPKRTEAEKLRTRRTGDFTLRRPASQTPARLAEGASVPCGRLFQSNAPHRPIHCNVVVNLFTACKNTELQYDPTLNPAINSFSPKHG